ncbi:TPA: hypothetical protein SMT72_003554 [Proteus mirabilis]|nr:hypothetical protein [Proteus mirabilis]
MWRRWLIGLFIGVARKMHLRLYINNVSDKGFKMRYLISILFIFFIGNVFAKDIPITEYQKCKLLKNSDEKLSCFDKLDESKVSEDANNNDIESKWGVFKEKSQLDDTETVILSVDGDSAINTSLLGASIPTLIVRCQNNKTQLYVVWGAYLGIDDIKVSYRIDKNKAITNWWSISTNNKSSFYNGNTISFIKSMFNKNNLFMQLTPYGENPVNVNFNITGLESKIKPLRNSCGW